jgi:hypothetical protein
MTPGHESAMGPGALPRGPQGAGRHHVAEVPHAGDLVPGDPRPPRGPGGSEDAGPPVAGYRNSGLPREPQSATSRPDARDLASGADHDPHGGAAGRRRDRDAPSDVHHHPRGAGDRALAVRMEVRLVGGEAGRALAATQGRALSALLTSLCETEVGQGKEVSP